MDKHFDESALADPLRKSEQRFQALVESIAIAVWESDAGGTIVVDSRQWREFTGQSVDHYLSSRWYDLVHPDDTPATLQRWTDIEQFVKELLGGGDDSSIASILGRGEHKIH